MISASPSPRVSNDGAASMVPGSTWMISRVRSATTPTAPPPIGSTTTLPGSSRPLSAGRPSSARSDTSGSRRSRNVTTPSTAVSDRATSEMWSGSWMISCTRSSGSAYSCPPSSKLTSETLRSTAVADGVALAAATEAAPDARWPETPSWLNSSRNIRMGLRILTVLSPSAPLMTPSRSIRVDRSGAGVVFLEPARRKRNQSVDAIDDVAHRRAARDHDDTRGFVQRCAGKAQQPAQIDHRQNHAVQIGEPNKALWRERHAGEVRHPDDFTDVAELKSELAAGQIETQRNSPHDPCRSRPSGSDRIAGIRRAASRRWRRRLGQRAGCV